MRLLKKQQKQISASFQIFTLGCVLAVSVYLSIAYLHIQNKLYLPKEAKSIETFSAPITKVFATTPLQPIKPVSTAFVVSALDVEPILENKPEVISLGNFTLTAYCPCVKCCEIWSSEHPSRIGTDYIQKTASGTIPLAGKTIAVRKNVIPFGTTVIISGHEYIVEDTGGGLKENGIDIYFDTHDEALKFGRQTAEVFIKNN